MTNCPTSPYGGAIIAALYLQEFVNKDITWVHFDVMVFNLRHLPGRPKGGGGSPEPFGIRAVFSYLQQR
jgi:leucyl aminopeptidase